jgi:GT2 family glycosyltransferase
MKIAIFLLFRAREHELTKNIVSLLYRENRNLDLRFFLFCNGPIDHHHRKIYIEQFGCEVIVSKVNIGVAPARNRLIDKSMKWGADLFISLDNDLVLPSKYIENVIFAYNVLKREVTNLGIIAPVIVDYRKFYDAGFQKCDINRWGEVCPLRKTKDIYYHLGVREWAGVYLHSPLYQQLRRALVPIKCMDVLAKSIGNWIAGSQIERQLLFEEPYAYHRVDTLPGGVHVFDREFRSSIGPFDERFAPYGNEDSEFCIRALFANYRSYLLKDICVIHDVDDRLNKRSYFFIKMLNGRARRLLVDLYVKSFMERSICYIDCVFLMPYHIVRYDGACLRERIENAFWYLYGFFLKPLLSEKDFLKLKKSSGFVKSS